MTQSKAESIELSVYLRIKEDIMSQRLPFGTKLVESELSAKYGVSRTPIRSALNRLSYEGLVILETNKGGSVVMPSGKELSDIVQTRVVLERAAMQVASKCITPEQLEYLGNLLKDEEECYRQRNLERFIRVNHEIHLAIAKASGNQCFIDCIDKLMTKSSIYLLFFDTFYTIPISDVKSIREHAQMYKALKSHDPAVCDLWEQHIASAFEMILKKFAVQPTMSFLLNWTNDD